MILVVGSTGVLGSEIVRQLRAENQPVKALVRKTSYAGKVECLKKLGAAIIEGDLLDKSSLLAACEGMTTVITTATTTASQLPGDSIPKVDQFGTLQLVEAAMQVGVPHFIYVSTRANLPECALNTAKRTLEDRIIGSGMTYTVVRPSVLMEIWLSPPLGFDYVNAQARIYGSGENPISWISVADVARFTIMAIDHPDARNAILELGGPENLSPNQVVQLFEEAVGRPFQADYVSIEAIEVQRSAATDPLLHSLTSLMLAYANGDPIDMQETLERFPVRLTSIKDYAALVAAAIQP